MQRKEALRLKRLWQLKSEKRSYFPYLPYFPYFPYYSLHEARAFQASSRLKRAYLLLTMIQYKQEDLIAIEFTDLVMEKHLKSSANRLLILFYSRNQALV